MTKREAFQVSMAMLSDTFARPLSKAALDAYWVALEALSAPVLAEAVKRALTTCRFMPTPAELLELAGAGGPRALQTEVADAWAAVRGAMDRHDYTTSVDFGPLVNSLVANLGGWQYLCGRGLDDLVWDRKKFEELYAAFRLRDPSTLTGAAPCAGAFGGAPVRIAIGGRDALKMLPSSGAAAIRDVARELVDEQGQS